jgi:hypothetical protein
MPRHLLSSAHPLQGAAHQDWPEAPHGFWGSLTGNMATK